MSEPVPGLSDVLRSLYGRQVSGTTHALRGEASTRRYHRFSVTEPASLATDLPRSLIVMQLPNDADNASASRDQARAFIDVQRLLRGRGVPVPTIHLADLELGLLLLEDLGEQTFEARLRSLPRARWRGCYELAIDLLADMHAACEPPRESSECIAYGRRFDEKLLRWELDHFRQWGLEAPHGELAATARAQLDAQFDALTQTLLALPVGFVHRDYQSRNLMWAPGERLVVIDFQDALLGPRPYDLVALLCDSYVDLDAQLQLAMLERYAQRRGLSRADSAELQRGFHLVAVQRKLKDAGRFVFIDRVRKNPSFLQHYPQSLRYVGRALAALPELQELSKLLARTLPGFPDAAQVPAAIS
ncbi:MAG TPA: phosphotransferase [Polyangiales bacterium]